MYHDTKPSYITTYHSGQLRAKIKLANLHLENCQLCPRHCGVNRYQGQKGFCQVGKRAKIYKYKLHHGEEPPISGSPLTTERGSGIIFFAGCTMACCFCQNYPYEPLARGYEVTSLDLARIMLELQHQGAYNINLVTSTQFIPQILDALELAIQQGLHLPIVYNTNGYDSLTALRLLDGIVDIYLPDMKYNSEMAARRFSYTPNYPTVNRQVVTEMYRQVGLLRCNDEGIALRGLIIRHLLLPNDLAGTADILRFIAELDPHIHVSLMSQYLPIWNARRFGEISRRITYREFEEALELLDKLGLHNGWVQDWENTC